MNNPTNVLDFKPVREARLKINQIALVAHVTVDPNILELIVEYTTKIHPTDKIPIFFEIDQIAEYANKHAGSYHDLTWFI